MASKEFEREIAKICQEVVAGFPVGSLVDHEAPDFLITTANGTSGVELEEFMVGADRTGAPLRETESLKGKAIARAQSLYEARHPGSHVHVYPHWRRQKLSWHDVESIAVKLSHLVSGLSPSTDNGSGALPKRDAAYSELRDAGLDEVFSHVTVYWYRKATYGLWASPGTSYLNQDLEEINASVRAKEGKVDAYRRHCQDLWLVLYSYVMPSGWFDLEVLEGHRVASGFDHVVFLDAASRQCVRLKG